MKSIDERHENFKRRMNKIAASITKDIDRMKNFTNGSYYSYDPKEIQESFRDIRDKLNAVEIILNNM